MAEDITQIRRVRTPCLCRMVSYQRAALLVNNRDFSVYCITICNTVQLYIGQVSNMLLTVNIVRSIYNIYIQYCILAIFGILLFALDITDISEFREQILSRIAQETESERIGGKYGSFTSSKFVSNFAAPLLCYFWSVQYVFLQKKQIQFILKINSFTTL